MWHGRKYEGGFSELHDKWRLKADRADGGWCLSAAQDKIHRAGVGYEELTTKIIVLHLGGGIGSPVSWQKKMFKVISQKHSICKHIFGTGRKHTALIDNELSREPYRPEWTAQPDILQITVVELCPGASALPILGGLHFKYCLSLQSASHNRPEGHSCLPGSQWQHLSCCPSQAQKRNQPTFI